MRWVFAGCIHLLLAATALAGVRGQVESIGFGSYLRSDCWVPLMVRIESDEPLAQAMSLQVVQLDLDGDEVVYTRPVTVNPGAQNVWTYFKPQPSNGGLPTAGTGNASTLAGVLRVYLATEDGGRRIAQVDVGKTLPQALETGVLEAITIGNRTIQSGQKLLIVVGDAPNFREYSANMLQTEGATEIILPVSVAPRRLPDNAIGYDAVDAVIWTTEDAARLDARQFRALRQYVLGGGQVVCVQSGTPGGLTRFNDVLPVTLDGTEEWSPDFQQTQFARLLTRGQKLYDSNGDPLDPFTRVLLPQRIGRVTAKDDALVAAWEGSADARRPLIVRRQAGLGSVIYVAVNVADPGLTRIGTGWPNFWSSVFDWKQRQRLPAEFENKESLDRYAASFDGRSVRDLGYTFTRGLNLGGRTSALVSIALVVFGAYWIIAGPGLYFVLAAQRRTNLSWFVFGGVAIVAVLVTLGVVRLVLGGSAELRHVSLVRVDCGHADEPARVLARVGIYLPQDRTGAPVAINAGSADRVSTLTPLVIAPRFVNRASQQRDSHYEVPVSSEAERPLLEVPFRSTLKQLEADWSGPAPGRITGSPALVDGKTAINGMLSNDTGQLLNNVLILFRVPLTNGETRDEMIYAKTWPAGKIVNLQQMWETAATKLASLPNGGQGLELNGDLVRGPWLLGAEWLTNELRGSSSGMPADRNFDDSDSYRRSFPLVSLFDATPAMINSRESHDRVDLLRSGVRQFDVSHALADGQMVILATSSSSPLPIPLTVDGVPPAGDGQTLWQFIVPLDRKPLLRALATQPIE